MLNINFVVKLMADDPDLETRRSGSATLLLTYATGYKAKPPVCLHSMQTEAFQCKSMFFFAD